LNPASREGNLSWVVPEIRPAPHKGDHPAAAVKVQNEYDRGRPGALPERTPAVDWCEQVLEPAEEISQVAPFVNLLEPVS
jgi:hypothetical protein